MSPQHRFHHGEWMAMTILRKNNKRFLTVKEESKASRHEWRWKERKKVESILRVKTSTESEKEGKFRFSMYIWSGGLNLCAHNFLSFDSFRSERLLGERWKLKPWTRGRRPEDQYLSGQFDGFQFINYAKFSFQSSCVNFGPFFALMMREKLQISLEHPCKEHNFQSNIHQLLLLLLRNI